MEEKIQKEQGISIAELLNVLRAGIIWIIGITFVGYFLGDNPATIKGVVKHIDYFLQKFGDDNISIGSDFNGTDYLPSNLKRYSHFKNLKNLLLKVML